MPGFDDDILDELDTRLPFIYEGFVVANQDPEKLGRIQFAVPGLMEPRSPWALPAATVGGGSKDTGFFAVPEVGAEVYVFFVAGDPDEPRYMAGHWGIVDGESEVPEEAQREEPTNRVLATPTFRIELDEAKGAERLRITNRRSGDFIELSATENSITIQGTTAVSIGAVGIIDIQAAVLQLNGRPVLPGTKPI